MLSIQRLNEISEPDHGSITNKVTANRSAGDGSTRSGDASGGTVVSSTKSQPQQQQSRSLPPPSHQPPPISMFEEFDGCEQIKNDDLIESIDHHNSKHNNNNKRSSVDNLLELIEDDQDDDDDDDDEEETKQQKDLLLSSIVVNHNTIIEATDNILQMLNDSNSNDKNSSSPEEVSKLFDKLVRMHSINKKNNKAITKKQLSLEVSLNDIESHNGYSNKNQQKEKVQVETEKEQRDRNAYNHELLSTMKDNTCIVNDKHRSNDFRTLLLDDITKKERDDINNDDKAEEQQQEDSDSTGQLQDILLDNNDKNEIDKNHKAYINEIMYNDDDNINNNRRSVSLILKRHNIWLASCRRLPYIDPKTKIQYDVTNPDAEGWLTKQSVWIKSWRRRYFMLKDTKLFFTKSRFDNIAPHGMIDLEDCIGIVKCNNIVNNSVVDNKENKRSSNNSNNNDDDDDDNNNSYKDDIIHMKEQQYMFEIKTTTTSSSTHKKKISSSSSSSYLLYADTETQRNKWISDIGRVIFDIQNKKVLCQHIKLEESKNKHETIYFI